jgi:hypothetical protein
MTLPVKKRSVCCLRCWRHQAEALGPKDMGSLAAEDQAILNDFLAEYGASAPGQDRTVTDADSAEQGDQTRPSQSDDESS